MVMEQTSFIVGYGASVSEPTTDDANGTNGCTQLMRPRVMCGASSAPSPLEECICYEELCS